ncbi:MAG: hypothetical protein ACI8R1_002431 [Psychrobacter glaciei]
MAVNKNNQEHAMTDSNKTDATTKMAPTDINQDGLDKKDQQRTDDSALDMMQGMHEHEDHDSEDDK